MTVPIANGGSIEALRTSSQWSKHRSPVTDLNRVLVFPRTISLRGAGSCRYSLSVRYPPLSLSAAVIVLLVMISEEKAINEQCYLQSVAGADAVSFVYGHVSSGYWFLPTATLVVAAPYLKLPFIMKQVIICGSVS